MADKPDELIDIFLAVSFSPQRIPSAAEYDSFASIYDLHMAVDFAGRIFPLLQSLVLKDLPATGRVLDLCCGTGRVTSALVHAGFTVDGVDASPEMLSLARRNAPGARFFLADARSFTVGERYCAVVSTFNSLAHVHTVADLTRVFHQAHAAVMPGAPLVFDLSMHEQYARAWRGQYTFLDAHAVCTIRASYDAELRWARNDITVLRREAVLAAIANPGRPGTAHGRNITILQKCHTEAEVRHALVSAGFEDIESFDAEQDLGMMGEAGRRIFRARRRR